MGHLLHAFVRRYLLLFVGAGHRFFTPVLCMLLLVFSANCALTIGDLQYSNPRADTHTICDTPTEIHDEVKLFAVQWSTGKIVTDEDEMELRYFSSFADAFFIVDRNAPKWTAQLMPPEYGLNCTNRSAVLPVAATVLPLRCPVKTFAETMTETLVRPDGNYLGQASETKVQCQPREIRVCARPEGVDREAKKWASLGEKGKRLTNDEKVFADAVSKVDIIFVFDLKAPPESVYWFVKDPAKLKCPGPPPQPYNEAKAAGRLDMMTAAVSMGAALTYHPGKDKGKPSDESSPDGQGPPLDFLDRVSRGLSITGALAQGDTSGNLKDANGSRYGIPNGKNPGGPNLWVLQAGVSLFAIVQNPIKTSRDFVKLIREGLAKGESIIIRDPKLFSKELAEKLAEAPEKKLTKENIDAAESFGESMAPSLNQTRTIMPYSRAEIFTAKWGGDYQAHHIYEVKWMLKHDKDAIKDAPAIILTKKEHEQITATLTKARTELLKNIAPRKVPERAELWNMYKEVYKDKPTWLEAIKGYFQR